MVWLAWLVEWYMIWVLRDPFSLYSRGHFLPSALNASCFRLTVSFTFVTRWIAFGSDMCQLLRMTKRSLLFSMSYFALLFFFLFYPPFSSLFCYPAPLALIDRSLFSCRTYHLFNLQISDLPQLTQAVILLLELSSHVRWYPSV